MLPNNVSVLLKEACPLTGPGVLPSLALLTSSLGPKLFSPQVAWPPFESGIGQKLASEHQSQHHALHRNHHHSCSGSHDQQREYPGPIEHQASPRQSLAAVQTLHHLWDKEQGCLKHHPQQHVSSHSFPSFASSHAFRRMSPPPTLSQQQTFLRPCVPKPTYPCWPALASHTYIQQRGYAVVPTCSHACGHQRGYAVVPRQGEEASDLPGLVEELQRQQIIRSPEVAAVLLYVNRALFLRIGFGEQTFKAAYKDVSLPIGHSQHLPAPTLHALCLELMRPHLLRGPGTRGLDVGCGTGYMAGCMAVMMGEGAEVVALERHERLMEVCAMNLTFALPRLLDKAHGGNLELWHDNLFDERVLPNLGTFDVIHVGAAATEDMVPVLTQLLSPGGRLVVPVGPPLGLQWLTVFDKALDGSLSRRQELEVKMMPLTRPASQIVW
mmetsp:Transcript_6705/g.17938  ORF Transcript_6705/g.17938 Transcript_6705/m.17938 type:complete len:439 (+) Transcript_6705:96-1412(+)|eukprot:CAMPEP_0202340388 /NCGR_PEP_ID=MMETSP1126-20121109/1848_1 /ASSEMBLY_ACC=CAM_ASM_000457 /TAXON_ID=3047 /ORGANISM="Dunaliella tertiolecta, Strain CCMP1320" /LENGTH=438 /DNA_ID=CAMNT_0048931085 /DNA_START=29 /DNA_END=1342 /DNA_ORIENTATION=-